MTTVLGRNVRVYVQKEEVFVLTACASSCSKEETAEVVQIRQNTRRENSYRGTTKDCTLSLEGVTTIDEITKWQFQDFIDSLGDLVHVKLVYENEYGDVLSYECDAIITSVTDQAAATDFATYSVAMLRSGAATTTILYNALQDDEGEYILDSQGNLMR